MPETSRWSWRVLEFLGVRALSGTRSHSVTKRRKSCWSSVTPIDPRWKLADRPGVARAGTVFEWIGRTDVVASHQSPQPCWIRRGALKRSRRHRENRNHVEASIARQRAQARARFEGDRSVRSVGND